MTKNYKLQIIQFFRSLDFPFLLLLFTLMVDTIWIKPLALLFSIFWIKDIDWKTNLKNVPPFYIIIIGLCAIQYFFIGDFTKEYLLFFGIGIAYWLFCIVAFILIYSRIKTQSAEKNEQTLIAFFWVNLFVTLCQLFIIMYQSGSINPFAIWDNPEYGTSTGDHLKGLFFAPCYINFIANSFFAIYFLTKKKLINSVFSVIILCLTSSNFAIIFFVPVYLIVSGFIRVPKAKAAALYSIAFICLFYGFISRANLYYMMESLFKIEHHYDQEKVGTIDTTVSTNKIVSKQEDIEYFKNNKGKIIAVNQTIEFVTKDWKNFLFGAGMGNFSSLLAKRQSDIQIEKKSRLFQKLPLRIAPSYRDNHYTIEKHLFNMSSDWHSIQQLPSSFFNQILGEYGALGTLAFLIFYIGFILKKSKINVTFFPIACLMGYYLLFDYLFEYLSIVVLFEVFYMIMVLESSKKEEVLNAK
jgi:hypothetical protein